MLELRLIHVSKRGPRTAILQLDHELTIRLQFLREYIPVLRGYQQTSNVTISHSYHGWAVVKYAEKSYDGIFIKKFLAKILKVFKDGLIYHLWNETLNTASSMPVSRQ